MINLKKLVCLIIDEGSEDMKNSIFGASDEDRK